MRRVMVLSTVAATMAAMMAASAMTAWADSHAGGGQMMQYGDQPMAQQGAPPAQYGGQYGTAQATTPPEVAQLRQRFEGLTLEQVRAAGYEPMHGCISNPEGPGAMGTHAINPALLEAQFPNGTMDPANPPVLLLGQENTVIGVEWEAADVGQGPMQLFGQTIQIQPGHPGAEEPHYMLHIYFQPDGTVLLGTDPQTAFNPHLSCPATTTMPATGGIASPAQLGGILLFALALGGLGVVGVAFAARQRLS